MTNIVAELQALAKLYEDNRLTSDEFTLAKAQVLGTAPPPADQKVTDYLISEFEKMYDETARIDASSNTRFSLFLTIVSAGAFIVTFAWRGTNRSFDVLFLSLAALILTLILGLIMFFWQLDYGKEIYEGAEGN